MRKNLCDHYFWFIFHFCLLSLFCCFPRAWRGCVHAQKGKVQKCILCVNERYAKMTLRREKDMVRRESASGMQSTF
ncbi:MAG: hypothetical protein JOS17DRAFT_388031 [Linnemannia elongata]|nr:MAG: hypothetical protein JOS17DRAFT_388031 [Linnemannia elongata]